MNYHSILGIKFDADPDEIKRAYKKLAMIHHPDRGGDEEVFKELKEAYEYLIEHPYEPPARSSFSDGYATPRPNPNGVKTPFRSAFDVDTRDPFGTPSKFEDVEINIPREKKVADPIGSAFGFGGWSGNNSVQYNIPLELAYTGGRVRLKIPNYLPEEVTLYPLTNDQTSRVVQLQSHSTWSSGRLENVRVVFHIVPHETYRLVAGDLYCTFRLKLIDMLNQVPLRIPHPNGKQMIPIQIPANYDLGSLIELPGLGFENERNGMRSNTGSIFVSIVTELPQLNNEQLRRIGEILSEPIQGTRS